MKRYKEINIFVTVLAVLTCNFVNGSEEFERYSQKSLQQFFHILKSFVDPDCQEGIDRMLIYLNQTESAAELIQDAYARSSTSKFANEQSDRWMHSGISCQAAASGTYGYNLNGRRYQHCQAHVSEPSQTISICIPQACASSNQLALKMWFEFTQNLVSENSSATDTQKMFLTTGSASWNNVSFIKDPDCMWSFWDKQWYQTWYTLLASVLLEYPSYLLVLIATIYQIKRHKQNTKSDPKKQKRNLKDELLFAFSLKLNLDKLRQMPSSSHRTITCLFGIRFLATCWTLLGHSYLLILPFLSNAAEFGDQLSNEFLGQIITNFYVSVDIFFLMSGCLTAFCWFSRIGTLSPDEIPTWSSWKYWLAHYRHRLFRIWPAYCAVLFLVALKHQFVRHCRLAPAGDGMLALALDNQNQCRDHFWENLIFINSLMPNRCIMTTWYIGTDMIFFFLSPLMLLLTRYSPRLSAFCGVGMVLGSALLRGGLTALYNFPPTQMWWTQPDAFNTDYLSHHWIIYVKPYTRIGPYIIGIGLGYIMASRKRLASTGLWIQLAMGWTLALVGGVWSLFGLYPALQNWNSGLWYWYNLTFASFHRTLFAMACAWVIFICQQGRGWWLDRMFSFKIFGLLGNLSYTSYLIQPVCIVAIYLWTPYPILWTGHGYQVVFLLLTFTFNYVGALIQSCTSEVPFINIEKIIFGGSAKNSGIPKEPSPANEKELQVMIELGKESVKSGT